MNSRPKTSGTAHGIVCSGNIVYDTLVKPVDELAWGRGTTFVDSIEYHVGGNGANTSRALGVLGVPVRLLGAMGDDAQGRFILDTLGSAGVETKYVERVNAPTTATVGVVNSAGDRKFFHRLGASTEAFREPIRFTNELCDGVVHYHMASLFVLPRLREHGAETLQAARAAGLTTSFDTNWDPLGGWMSAVEPCLPYLDFLFMNEDEAFMVTGTADPAAGARVVIEKGLRVSVMKLGQRGCAIYTNEREHLCPAFDVDCRDTTGAGDSFVAGFLAASLQGASLPEAGEFANAVAGLSVQKMGAVTGVLPYAETERWMMSAPIRGAST